MAYIKPGIYRHYKGNDYQVFGLAHHSETDEYMVLYKPLYGAPDSRELWVRPLEMFLESVSVGGKDIDRFRYIGGAESHSLEADIQS